MAAEIFSAANASKQLDFPPRLLLLGNSLTTANGMPETLARITGAQVDVHARGGARLAEHLNPATRLGAATQKALSQTEGPLRFVILQEMSHQPATNPKAYRRAVDALCQQAHAAGVLPVIFDTWPYAPDCPKLEKLDMSHQEMAQRIAVAFQEAALDNGTLLAGAGRAFLARESRALWAADGVHPSPEGSALAARCIAEACGLLKENEEEGKC